MAVDRRNITNTTDGFSSRSTWSILTLPEYSGKNIEMIKNRKKEIKGTKWMISFNASLLFPEVNDLTYRYRKGPWRRNKDTIMLDKLFIGDRNSWVENVYKVVKRPKYTNQKNNILSDNTLGFFVKVKSQKKWIKGCN